VSARARARAASASSGQAHALLQAAHTAHGAAAAMGGRAGRTACRTARIVDRPGWCTAAGHSGGQLPGPSALGPARAAQQGLRLARRTQRLRCRDPDKRDASREHARERGAGAARRARVRVALELLQELALAHARRVLAEVHHVRAPDRLGHGRVDQRVQAVEAGDGHHLGHLRRRAAVVPRREAAAREEERRSAHRCGASWVQQRRSAWGGDRLASRRAVLRLKIRQTRQVLGLAKAQAIESNWPVRARLYRGRTCRWAAVRPR